MSAATIERERHGDVVVLWMSNGKVNVLDLELLTELTAALRELAAEGPPIVLTGRGSAFSAGVDLKRIVAGGAPYVEEYLPALTAAFRALFGYPGPAVAAVNGHAIAGGFVLAAACDFRLAAQGGGRLGLSELQVGVPFPVSAIEIVREAAGAGTARLLALGAQLLDVPAALDARLVDEVVEPAALLPAAVDRAASLAARGLRAYRLTKQLLRAPAQERIERNEGYDAQVRALWAGQESLGRIQAFLDSLR